MEFHVLSRSLQERGRVDDVLEQGVPNFRDRPVRNVR